jgi:hypothetical protein
MFEDSNLKEWEKVYARVARQRLTKHSQKNIAEVIALLQIGHRARSMDMVHSQTGMIYEFVSAARLRRHASPLWLNWGHRLFAQSATFCDGCLPKQQ